MYKRQQNYQGFSPIIGKELIYRAGIDPNIKWGLVSEDEKARLNDLLYDLKNRIINDNLESYSYEEDGKVKEFHTIKLSHLAYQEIQYNLMSESIEHFYEYNKTNDRFCLLYTSDAADDLTTV